MKKKLLLLMALATVSLGIQAQLVKQQMKPQQGPKPHRSMAAPALAEGNGIWWGYYDGVGERSALGVQSAETYYQAIRIDPTNATLVGKTITKVRIYLRELRILDGVSLWLSTTLPDTPKDADVALVELKTDELSGGDEGDYYNGMPTDITLPSPYTVTEKGVYVGLTYTVTDASSNAGQYPIVTTYGVDEVPNALFLKTSSSVTSWQDLSQQGYGNLAMQLLLEGDFAGNGVSVVGVDELVVASGQTVNRNVTFNNAGSNGISSIDYTITAGGVESELQHLDLPAPFGIFGGNVAVKLPFTGAEEAGKSQVTISVKKVNGEDNEVTEGASFTTEMTTVARKVERKAVVEEFTGLTCGWCPRGIVGMEKAREHFGDQFIGIAVHGFSSASTDAMTYLNTGAYARIFSGSAPACHLNRSYGEIDPKEGYSGSIISDIQEDLDNVAAKVDVSVDGEFSEDNKKVNAHAQVEALSDDSYTVAFAVVADGLSGSGSGWIQYNYYYQYTPAQVGDPDLMEFCKGGSYGKSSVPGLKFNDAMMVSSYVSGNNKVETLGTMTTGQVEEREYTLTLPTRTSLKTALASAIDEGRVYIVALVIDGNGRITNAAKAQVQAATTAIQGVSSNTGTTEVARYNADGVRLQAPARGINIVRMSDGTVRKVVVE